MADYLDWIDCNIRLPENNQNVLFIQKKSNEILSGYFQKDKNHFEWKEYCTCGGIECEDQFYREEIIFWMPSPKLPIGANKK